MIINGSDTSIAVTGHQPYILGGYSNALDQGLYDLASGWLKANQPREVVSGLAAGWDTAVASAALDQDIPLIAALAYQGQADQWPPEAKTVHEKLRDGASEIYQYSREKAHGCYTRRDRWVLERGDIVLALWSGADGGTARAVATAQKLGKPIINLWSDYSVTSETGAN